MNGTKSTRAKNARPVAETESKGVPANGSDATTIADTINEAIVAAHVNVNGENVDALKATILALEKKIESMASEKARTEKNAPSLDAVGLMESFLTDTDGAGRKAFIAALSKVAKIDGSIAGARIPKSLPGLFLELVEMHDTEMYAGDKAYDLGNTFGQNMGALQARVMNAKPNAKTGLFNEATEKARVKLNAVELRSALSRFTFGMIQGSLFADDKQRSAKKYGASKIVGAPVANDSDKFADALKRKIG